MGIILLISLAILLGLLLGVCASELMQAYRLWVLVRKTREEHRAFHDYYAKPENRWRELRELEEDGIIEIHYADTKETEKEIR